MKKIILSVAMLILLSNIWSWAIEEQKDSFGDYCGEYFLIQNIENGKFSNTATNESLLTGYIYITSDKNLIILLIEYDRYVASFEKGFKKLSVKQDDDTVVEVEGFTYSGIFFEKSGKGCASLKEMLQKNKTLKFYFRDDTSSYRWTVDCIGFTNAYSEFKVKN